MSAETVVGLSSLQARVRAKLRRAQWLLSARGPDLLKRGLDVAVSAAMLLCLSPLFAIVALMIMLDDPGPVLFAQTRVGLRGRSFRLFKFRTMIADAEKLKASLAAANEMKGGVTFKMRRDPRITRVGQNLRRWSIDELPQLWNVFCGDMTLVGPRPPVPKEVDLYELSDRRRLDGVPGLTCIWQVSGRSEIPFKTQVEMDAEYLATRKTSLDLRLLLKTLPAVFGGRGAF